MGALQVGRLDRGGRKLIRYVSAGEQPHLRLLFFQDVALGIEKAKATDGVELQLAFEDRTGLIFITATNGDPIDSRKPGFLHLVLFNHRSSPEGDWFACRRHGVRRLVCEKAKGVPRTDLPALVHEMSIFTEFLKNRRIRNGASTLGKCCNFSNTCHQNDTEPRLRPSIWAPGQRGGRLKVLRATGSLLLARCHASANKRKHLPA
jgi:hypothetical protein